VNHENYETNPDQELPKSACRQWISRNCPTPDGKTKPICNAPSELYRHSSNQSDHAQLFFASFVPIRFKLLGHKYRSQEASFKCIVRKPEPHRRTLINLGWHGQHPILAQMTRAIHRIKHHIAAHFVINVGFSPALTSDY
jgi:hypothetical protein